MFAVFFSILAVSLLSFASADAATCNLEVSLINQDPYPAIPGDYVNLVFQISGVQNSYCEGAWAELVPSYPFSLDENDALRTLNGSTWTSNNKNEWMIPFKLRVDKDALDGNASIEVHYNSGKNGLGSYYMQKFNIIIQDSRTNFDAVIQETSGNDVSIAIANTGKYTANSVVVRIPEQDSFMVGGTDGQMVGNLESGDYTIVGFNIIPKMQPNMQNASRTNFHSSNLKFDIYYTDNLGERRIVNMELPLNLAETGNFTMGNFNGIRRNGATASGNNSIWSSWYVWLVLVIAALLIYGFYHKYRRKIRSLLLNKKDSSEKVPDWIKNAKDKEKRK